MGVEGTQVAGGLPAAVADTMPPPTPPGRSLLAPAVLVKCAHLLWASHKHEVPQGGMGAVVGGNGYG